MSFSSWTLLRGGRANGLADGGTLGGSQAGVRALFPLGRAERPMALAARLSGPLGRRGAEAAIGVEYQPLADVPIRLLAERRQRLFGEGRSAFALLAHGGVSDRPVARGFVLDGYAQVGIVGARSRDLFADGGLTLTKPTGVAGVRLGAGAWGGVQPGLKRLDAGPTASLNLKMGQVQARISTEYRFRVAGDAAPGSGPVITIGTSF